MRVLVTGSRAWRDRSAVDSALEYHWGHSTADLIVVHGDCPTGADRIAREWVEEMRRLGFEHVDQERHAAKWQEPCGPACRHQRTKNGRTYYACAGHVRNKLMVDLGAKICVAFPLGKSPGTRGCMKLAEQAHMPIDNLGDE